MRIVSWNIRGLGAEVKVSSISKVIRNVRANFCFLQESKLESVPGDLVRKMWYDDNYDFRFSAARGRLGGLISIWNKDYFQIISDRCLDRAIVIVGKWKIEGLEATMINVYAPNATAEQRVLWDELSELRSC